jgi:hypothetical protein
VIINLLIIAMLIYRYLNSAGPELRILIPYGLFLLFLGTRARRLKKRVAEIVDVAAFRIGLERLTRRKAAHGDR